MSEGPILLFDGVCNLCDGFVRFVIARDPAGIFRFSPLQSPKARELLKNLGLPEEYLTTMVLIEDGRAYTRSDAALRVGRRLGGVWKLTGPLAWIPRPARDLIYSLIASRRYRWFGKKAACLVPTPEIKSRFLA